MEVCLCSIKMCLFLLCYLSPSDILFNFSNIKDQLAFQLNFLVSNPLYSQVLVMAGKVLPVTIIYIIFQWLLIFIKNKKNLLNTAVFLIPLSFLSPHIFYQVHTYFPRHIMMGYLFMIIATIFINSERKENAI